MTEFSEMPMYNIQRGARGFRRHMPVSVFCLFLILPGLVSLVAVPAAAEWRVDIESKTVQPGETGVTVAFTVSWDDTLMGLTIPLVVREIDPGAFWTGALPYDTAATAANHPHVQGVTWNWVSPWAYWVEEVKPITGVLQANRCTSNYNDEYDGVSPDHLAINAVNVFPGAAPEPQGRIVVTLSFAVTAQAGMFEFDTTCFTDALRYLSMIDDQFPPVDHGPGGINDVVFNKGVITIQSPGGILETADAVPSEFGSLKNYPNPFNGRTKIEFALPRAENVRIEVFDILGRNVVTLLDGFQPPGPHEVWWDGCDGQGKSLGSGIYFCHLVAGDENALRKMILLK